MVYVKRPFFTNVSCRLESPIFLSYLCLNYLLRWVFPNKVSIKGWVTVGESTSQF